MTDSLGKYSCMYEAEPAGSGQREGIVCQSLCKDFKQLQSQTAGITPQLTHRYVGIARSNHKYN